MKWKSGLETCFIITCSQFQLHFPKSPNRNSDVTWTVDVTRSSRSADVDVLLNPMQGNGCPESRFEIRDYPIQAAMTPSGWLVNCDSALNWHFFQLVFSNPCAFWKGFQNFTKKSIWFRGNWRWKKVNSSCCLVYRSLNVSSILVDDAVCWLRRERGLRRDYNLISKFSSSSNHIKKSRFALLWIPCVYELLNGAKLHLIFSWLAMINRRKDAPWLLRWNTAQITVSRFLRLGQVKQQRVPNPNQ